jgi:hypothetical protein
MDVYFTLMSLITHEDAPSLCEIFKSDVEPTFFYFSEAYLFNDVLDKYAVMPLFYSVQFLTKRNCNMSYVCV